MNSSEKSLLENITQEIRLPEIDADACMHALCNDSDCHACVAICPTQAWILDDDNLGLDVDACTGCGLCIPACPGGALHIDLPWVIRTLGSRMVALFACEKSAINESNGILPCVHALGLRPLLQLYNAGIEHLLLATDDCSKCTVLSSQQSPLEEFTIPKKPAETIYSRVEKLNTLLLERNKAPIKLLKHSTKVWKKLYSSDETINRGTQLSRRNFLSGGGQNIRQQLVLMDPLNLPEYRSIPPGELLPESDNSHIKWPWVVNIEQSLCNGCDACIRLCPTGALQLIHHEDSDTSCYQINTASCTGCAICSAVCDKDAITIDSWTYLKTDAIDLSENKCSACGNTFHLPVSTAKTEQQLCRICLNHNHTTNLFQVLD